MAPYWMRSLIEAVKPELTVAAIGELPGRPYPTLTKFWSMNWHRPILIDLRPKTLYRFLIHEERLPCDPGRFQPCRGFLTLVPRFNLINLDRIGFDLLQLFDVGVSSRSQRSASPHYRSNPRRGRYIPGEGFSMCGCQSTNDWVSVPLRSLPWASSCSDLMGCNTRPIYFWDIVSNLPIDIA